MKYDALLVASGKGERAKLGFNKVFYVLKNGQSVLEKALELFLADEDCKRIIIVTNEENFELVPQHEKIIVCEGGAERKDSVKNGLALCFSDYVLIHDAARPFLSLRSLEAVKEEVVRSKACILAKRSVDTVKLVKDGRIVETIDRNNVFLAETPQAFKTVLIKEAHDKSFDFTITDDASMLEALGYPVSIVEDLDDNHKLTRPEDFYNL